MAFYEPTSYESNSFYNSNVNSASEETLLLATSLGLGIDSYSTLGATDSISSYPLYDPDSPFNSPIVPIRTMGKDGILKTSLMGIGNDPSGFLTSPLVFNKLRVTSINRTPRASTSYLNDVQVASPVTTPMMSESRSLSGNGSNEIDLATPRSTPRNSISSLSSIGGGGGSIPLSLGIASSSRTSVSMTSGIGMNLGNVASSNLGGGLEMDYGIASTSTNMNNNVINSPRNYNSNIPHPIQLRQPPNNVNEYPVYPDTQPLVPTFGRGRSILPPSSSSKFVEHRFPVSPPLQTGGIVPSTTKRPSKANSSTRQISKAKSCSSLAQPPPKMIAPLTPVQPSRQIPNFPLPGVPYNSPVDNFKTSADKYSSNLNDNVKVEATSVMPFSFADLYNFGLAVDSVDEIDPRKSPYQFANDLLLSENGGLPLASAGGYTEDNEFNILHSLPTPYLAHGSGFSSPSSIYLSDTSPELGMAYLSPGQLSSTSLHSAPSLNSNPMMQNPSITSSSSMISTQSMLSNQSLINPHSMIPAASLEYHLSPGLVSAQLPNPTSRQRCINYASQQSMIFSDPLPIDASHLQSPTHQHTHSRTLSTPGVAHFSYPSRFTPDQSRQHLSPYQAPTATTSYDFNPIVDPSLFLPPLPQHHDLQQLQQQQQSPHQSNQPHLIPPQQHTLQPSAPIRNSETFERNLETFDDIYEAYSQSHVSTNQSTPNKRGRGSEDEKDDEDASGDYVPNEDTTPRKKLRTVASAPNLTSASKRMRPGPKPKITRSPQELQQSVFSAISPPPLPNFKRFPSPYHSDGEALYGSDDEFAFNESGTQTGSVPKEVIRSLYSGVAGHNNGGVKVSKRYVCLIEGCDRTFPRKSAIESHIQTHLEDKPFTCPQADCDASFVRQHDLRRHERIHSGNKPFPCPCGKGFARGDALARHRARGICEGSLVPRRI